MKTYKLFLASIIMVVTSANHVFATTADELAAFFGISSWHTAINVPGDRYSVQIFRFADGKTDDADLGKVTKIVDSPNELAIVAGGQDGKYKFILISANGSYGFPTREPVLGRTQSPHLPEKIGEGSFILFGEPLVGDALHGDNDIHSYSKGYLLLIKKKDRVDSHP